MTETDIAYLAGIIDGEGSIGFYVGRRTPGGNLTVQVTSTCLELLEWICSESGGSVVNQPRWQSLGSKPCYSWAASGERAAIILASVLPYLIIKHDHASKLIARWMESEAKMTRPARRRRQRVAVRAEMRQRGWSVDVLSES